MKDGRVVAVIVDTDAHSPARPEPEQLRSLQLIGADERWPFDFCA